MRALLLLSVVLLGGCPGEQVALDGLQYGVWRLRSFSLP